MSKRPIHFRENTDLPRTGHQKGANSHGYSGPSVQLETAPGRLGKAGYVRVKK